MAWTVNSNNLIMCEGDYGVELPITISGVTFAQTDALKFTFKSKVNGDTILEKTYTPNQNKVTLVLTYEETALFPVGNYVYSLDWYQDGAFLCNVIPTAAFKVVDKA